MSARMSVWMKESPKLPGQIASGVRSAMVVEGFKAALRLTDSVDHLTCSECMNTCRSGSTGVSDCV